MRFLQQLHRNLVFYTFASQKPFVEVVKSAPLFLHVSLRPLLDSKVPNNISKYNYKDRMYKVDPPGPGDHLAMHLAIDGWALFREGDEAKLQTAAEEKKKAAADEARKVAHKQVWI